MVYETTWKGTTLQPIALTQSGLTARVLSSKNSTESVAEELLQYIRGYVPEGEGYLAGHCVYVDREFMRLEFPRVLDYLHWRLVGCDLFQGSADIDVSTVRFLSNNWSPGIKDASPLKKKEHRAMDD